MASIEDHESDQELFGATGQHDFGVHRHWVRGRDELEKIVRYIEENPVAAGLVERVSHIGMTGQEACPTFPTPVK